MELIFIPIVISLTHFLGMTLDIHKSKYFYYVKSLVAGISSGYVFLFLLPDLSENTIFTSQEIFIFVLISFTLFHIIHQIVKQKTDSHHSKNILELTDGIFMSLYNFIATYLILQEINNDPTQGFVLFMVLIVHSLLFDVIDEDFEVSVQIRAINRFIIPIASILAGFVFLNNLLPQILKEVLLSFGVGSLIYISIREEIPSEKRGKPFLFAIGAIIVILTVIFI